MKLKSSIHFDIVVRRDFVKLEAHFFRNHLVFYILNSVRKLGELFSKHTDDLGELG